MGLLDVARTLAEVPTLLALKKGMRPRALTERDCFGAAVERLAARIPDRSALVCEGRELTWGEFNALANRYAAAFKAQGLSRGDTASVFMENRIEYLATLVGLNKIGVIGSLINTNLRGRSLIHCISVTGSSKCIFGEELADALAEVKGELALDEGADYLWVADGGERSPANWAVSLNALIESADAANPADTAGVTLGDTALYIFTSGTTGLPKAAVLSNRRYLSSAGLASKAGLKCTERDRLYICLPLYHGTGLMIGVGASFSSGASMFLRRRFSASNFLDEVRAHNTTCLIYIGELCRYLMNTPARPDDADNPLRSMMGNGLRPDVWMPFKRRFGVKRIAEFYGASEGNVAFANLLNKNCTVGMTSAPVALVRYDIDADELVRDAAGHCIPVADGEPGLLLGRITEESVFEGYTNADATESKIIRNVFEDGDAWFNSGDLMKTVEVGFSLGFPHYQFVDRIGDTFRWKSENVSTNEVGEILNGFPQVRFSNVYGVQVPGADGRAGMASLTLEDGVAALDVQAFGAYVRDNLPSYARPVFVRVQQDFEVTGTFKMVKRNLKDEGFDPGRIRDPLYVQLPQDDGYRALTPEIYERICSGAAGY
ncbi:MAG: long-chain-acyl-CoA synthetase [Pseudomonadales bacterium]